MARNQYDPLALETYSEPVNEINVWDYLTSLGYLGRGVAGGAVKAPYLMSKGVDDVVDIFKGQDPSKDVGVVRGAEILNQIGTAITPKNEIGRASSELLGENILGGALGRGAITGSKIAANTAGTMAPAVVQEEAKRLGMSDGQAIIASMLASASPTAVSGPTKMGVYGSDVSQLGKIGGERAKQRVIAPEDPSMIGQRVSTANPTAKVAEDVGFHQTDQFAISGDMMMYNPDALKHNMELMSKYPALSTTARKAEGRFGDFKTTIIDNLDYYIKQSPTEFIERSTNWYKGANALANDMSRSYGLPVEATSGVLARLSPGMDWFQNVEQADRLVEIFTTKKNTPMPKGAGKFEGKALNDMDTSAKKAEWIRAYDEATNERYYYQITPEGAIGDLVTTKEGKPSSFMWQSNKNLELAVDMLENPTTENISKKLGLGGHKIRNFYNNIVDPFNPSDVTIDTHAVSAALMTPYSQKGVPVGHAFGGGAIKGEVAGSSKSGMASGTYGLYADAYREAAQRNDLRAMELQSPTWEIIRETFPTSGSGKAKLQGQIAPIQEAVRKGQMTQEQGRNAIIDIASGGKGLQFPSWMNQ